MIAKTSNKRAAAATEDGDTALYSAKDDCHGLAQILSRIGDKWTVMVVGNLSGGTLRFNKLLNNIPGISHRMLTLTLRGLERDGLVKRTAFATIPPRVEYELTNLGRSLTGPLKEMGQWARRERREIEAAREKYDATHNLQNGS